MTEVISSHKNPRVKEAVKLRDRRIREQRGQFVVEGFRELMRALAAGYELLDLFICNDFLTDDARDLLKQCETVRTTRVSPEVMGKLALRESSGGLFGIFKCRVHSVRTWHFSEKPLVLATCGIEKPGNLGALFRTADAAAVDGIIIVGKNVDIYNPNVIRASLGTVFQLPSAIMEEQEFWRFCEERALKVAAAALDQRAIDCFYGDFTGGSVILLGPEDKGLPRQMIERSDEVLMIPMGGVADSLNVAAAGAVLLFEAVRQRRLASNRP